jgi:uncharacterized membrane protein YkgB
VPSLLLEGFKFATFEAEAIQLLLAYSLLLSWMLAVFEVRTATISWLYGLWPYRKRGFGLFLS